MKVFFFITSAPDVSEMLSLSLTYMKMDYVKICEDNCKHDISKFSLWD